MSLLREIIETLNEAKELSNRFNKLLAKKDFEKEFKDMNIGKDICLITKDGKEKRGKLVDIDKYKMVIKVDDDREYAYYKSGLIGFYVL